MLLVKESVERVTLVTLVVVPLVHLLSIMTPLVKLLPLLRVAQNFVGAVPRRQPLLVRTDRQGGDRGRGVALAVVQRVLQPRLELALTISGGSMRSQD